MWRWEKVRCGDVEVEEKTGKSEYMWRREKPGVEMWRWTSGVEGQAGGGAA